MKKRKRHFKMVNSVEHKASNSLSGQGHGLMALDGVKLELDSKCK